MPVNFASYHIAMSGMRVNQHGLNVTGHNIANVNTPGYVRQQSMITNSSYQTQMTRYGLHQFGLGADIQEVRQIRHMFLDGMYRKENTTLGYWEARNKTFQDVQAILGEPMDVGLQDVLNQFWDSWQELSKAPDSLTVRALVRQRGENLVHHINHLGQQLDKLQDDLNKEIEVRINEVNNILEKIAELNVNILKTEVSGDSANDFRDQRNNLVDRLTKLVNCDVHEMQDGQLDILVGGYFLVTKGIHKRLYAAETQKGGLFYVPKLEGTDIEIPLSSGTIKGLMESRGEVLGSKGSIENGTPNTKADIVIAIDVSDTSGSYLDDVKANISSYIDELEKRGIDYNLRLVTYDDQVVTNNNYGSDHTSFLADVASITPTADTDNNFGGANGVLEALEGITNWQSTNRYAMVFTGESIDGNAGAAVIDASGYIDRLNSIGVKTSVVTDTSYYNSGNPGGEVGWNEIANGTGGNLYDINTAAADYAQLMSEMGSDLNTDINYTISSIENTNNIVSNLRRKLNALVNIVVREINYLHKSGKTMANPPTDGQDFFVAIDPELPLEMGNIKLNDNLEDLNNIVASTGSADGDNTIAKQIANLRHKPAMMDATGVLDMDDYYQSIILSIGNGGADADRIAENQRKLVQSADAYRQSIMGVSMDEEMTNMMKYKFAYNASSRAINVIDEMIETVITRLGLVGR